MPYQCFINGQFEDAENGKTYNTINPTDGSVSRMTIRTNLSTHTHTHTQTQEVKFKEPFGITETCVATASFTRLSVRCPTPQWGMWTGRWQLPKKLMIMDPGAG